MAKAKIIACCACGKDPLTKNEIGINKKMYGAKPKMYFCLECLAEHIGATPQDILDTIEDYKSQGCIMFE